MLHEIVNQLSEQICDRLIDGQDSLAFPVLIKKPLPNWFIEYLNFEINPNLNDHIKIGSLDFDFSLKRNAAQLMPKYKQALNNDLMFSRSELYDFITDALNSHVQVLIHPADEISSIVYKGKSGENLSGRDLSASLTSLSKLMEWRGELIPNVFLVIKPYLAGLNTQSIAMIEFSRTLASALEKEIASDPFSFVELDLNRIKELISPTGESEELDFSDLIEDVNRFLINRGLASWTPAIAVESAINDGKLNFQNTIKALKRLQVYRDNGLIGVDSEEQSLVDDEVDNFTNFIDMVSE